MPDGNLRTYIAIKAPLLDENGKVYALCGISTDISEQKETEAELRESAERERVILNVVEKIRASLDLDEVFQTVTEKLRETLKCDRVVLFQFNPDWSIQFVAESITKGGSSITDIVLNNTWNNNCLLENEIGRYQEGKTFAIADIEVI